jgi:hypothetical protein
MSQQTITIELDYLFNLVNQRTLYIADQVNPELNEKMIEKIPITMDEYDAFLVFVRRGAVEVFKKLSRMMFDIEDAFTYTITYAGVYTEINYIINIPDEKQESIILSMATDHIQRALVAFVVMEWLRTKQIDSNYFRLDQHEYEYCLMELSRLKNYSSKPKLTYRTF